MNLRSSFKRVLSVFKDQASVVPVYVKSIGEPPALELSTLRSYYLHDPDVYAAVNYLANRAISPGFYITVNEDYLGGRVKELIDDWNENVQWGDKRCEKGLDSLLRIVFRELIWAGNSFVEMVEPDKLKGLNLLACTSIKRIRRDEFGQSLTLELNIGGKIQSVSPDRVTHFAWNIVDRSAFGYSLIHSLCERRIDLYGRTVPPLLDIKTQIENDMRRALHRYGTPRSIYSFHGLGEEKVRQYADALRDPEADASFATNVTVDIKSDSPDPRSRFDGFIEYFRNRIHIGLQTPVNILLSEPGQFSEASSRTAAQLGDIIVDDLCRLVKRTIEHEWYERILEQHNLDPFKAGVRLHFRQPEVPTYQVQDVVNAFNLGVITRAEARRIFRRVGWELEEDQPIQGQPPEGA